MENPSFASTNGSSFALVAAQFPWSTFAVPFLAPLLIVILFKYASIVGQQYLPTSPTGCRKLGLVGPSNLDYLRPASKPEGRTETTSPEKCRIQALFIYPIKSCGPVELDKSTVVRTGMAYDRQFTFAWPKTSASEFPEGPEWNFVTQRQVPLLAKLDIELWLPDPSSPTYSPDAEHVKTGGCIIVRFPAPSASGPGRLLSQLLFPSTETPLSFTIPFHLPPARISANNLQTETLTVWRDTLPALNVTPEIPPATFAALKRFLGVTRPFALMRIDPERPRELFRCAPRKEQLGYQPIVHFADAYPIHLLGISSVNDLAAKINKDYLNPVRFRSNVLVTGTRAYAEDTWQRVRLGSQEYHVSCRTVRCKLPNVDPDTGVADETNEPYNVMTKHRRIDKGAGLNPCLGMQLTPFSKGEGSIAVGDVVEVLEETDGHYFIKMFS